MANSKIDDNRIPTMTGVLNTDGTTVTNIKANPTTHFLDVIDGATGSDFGADLAARDANGNPVMIAVSSADGVTPVPLYVDSNGNLLTDSS